jgi:hypothetical protein
LSILLPKPQYSILFIFDTLKSGKLTDEALDVLTNAAKEISAKYKK